VIGRYAALLAAGLLLSGCPIPYDPRIVSIETVERTYAAGDAIIVVLVNIGEDPLTYSPCGTFLDRKEFAGGVHWVTIAPAAPPAPCQDVLLGLATGATDSVTYLLAGDTPSGIYRYRFDALYRDGEQLPVGDRSSHSFGVTLP
jgi:hypothetical protein